MFNRFAASAVLLCSLLVSVANAQNRFYHVYLDTDANDTTGCVVNLPDFATTVDGVESRLTITTDSAAPPNITATNLHQCVGAAFDGGTAISPAALGLNTGVGGADVFEAAVQQSNLSLTGSRSVYLYYHNESDTAADVVLTDSNGGPITLGFALPVPGLGMLAIGLLLLSMLWLTRRQLSRQLTVGILFIGVSTLVWAATIIVDGMTNDWSGISPANTDPIGDTTANGSYADLTAVFATKDQNRIYFRMDVVDVENQAPVADPTSDTTFEDNAVTITLTGSDPEGAPITFATGTAPANGTLSNYTVVNNTTSTVLYTPNADFNGNDSFTVVANDGQVNSAPANVDVTVDPVNDAPVFTSGGDVSQLKTAGPYNAQWATAIQPGPADEAGQSVIFNITNNDNPGIFSAQPTLTPSGVLSFTGLADVSGVANITVNLSDDGGTANGGIDTSADVTFAITLVGVNDEPSFTVGPDQTGLEDAGPVSVANWATNILAGPPDEAGQVLTFNITANDNPGLFSAGPAVAANGTLTYTTAADANGVANITLELMDDGGTANGGDDTSPPATFMITITGVNDAPSFTAGADQNVLEESGAQSVPGWATAIVPGPADEAGQSVSFIVTNDNNALFSVQPAIDPAGNLTYTPAANTSGAAVVSVSAMDDGGTANGGVDTSAVQTFNISVTQVNDEPSFTVGADETILEDAGAQSVVGWATGISAGPPDEAGQILTFNITANDNPGLFAAGPAVAANGTLTYTPAANANGVANISLELMDNGGTANGGDDTSPTQSFSITVTAVNDAPAFTAGSDQSVLEESGAQTINGWATGISPGPADEAGQSVSFNVSNDNNGLFSAQPAIDIAGNLTYTPTANFSGTAIVTVSLSDNGGTANGGVDTSANQTFNITVIGVNDAPSFTAGADETVNEDSGPQSVPGWATAISAGPPDEAGQNLTFNITANDNPGLFSAGPAVSATGELTYTTALNANGTANITLELMDDGGTANGGIDTSPTQSFAINVTPVNDPPSLTAPGPFAVTSHIRISVPDGVSDLLAGATDVEAGTTLTIDDVDGIFATVQGGTVTADINTGAFTYDPPAGYTGADSFMYSVCDDGVPAPAACSAAQTVTFNVSGNKVWFIDDSAAPGGDGTLATPFDTLADFNGSGLPAAGDFVFLFSGNHGGSGITLLNNQVLFGQGSTGSFDVIAGITAAPFSIARPTLGGVDPVITSGANGINLGQNNTIRGLAVGNTTGFAIRGTTAGNLTVSETSITGNGGAIEITTSAGFASTAFDVLESNTSGTGALNLNNVSGTLVITSAGLGIANGAAAPAVRLNGGDLSMTYPGNIGNSVGRSIDISNKSGGTITFSGLITDSGSGINLATNAGTYNFNNVDLDTTTNTAFSATGGGLINITGTTSTIDTTTGNGFVMDGSTVGVVNLQRLSVNGAVNGLFLQNSGGGTFTVLGDGTLARNGSGGTIQNTTGDGVFLNNANNVTLRSVNLINVGDNTDSGAGGNTLATNDHAIESSGGNNIILSGVFINNPAAGGWEAVDLGGTNAITNDSRFQGINASNMQALEIRNTNTNLTLMTIDDSEFGNQATTNGSAYVLFQSLGNANMTINMQNNSLVEQTFGMGVQANSNVGGAVTLNISGSTFQNAVNGTVGLGASGGLNGLVAAASTAGRINYNINTNTFNDIGRPLVNGGVVTVQAIGGNNKIVDGEFDGNFVSRIGYPTNSEPSTAVGHRFIDVVTENDIIMLDHEADGNTINDTSREAFFISSRGASSDFDASLTNNNLGQTTAIGQTNREAIEILSEDSSDMEILINNNTVRGNTSALDQVVDIDTENTSFMDMRFNNNTVTNLQAAGGLEIVMDTENGTSNHCLQFTGNTAVDVEFDVNGTAHNIEDFANIAANNPGVSNFIDGAGVTNVAVNTCQTPTF